MAAHREHWNALALHSVSTRRWQLTSVSGEACTRLRRLWPRAPSRRCCCAARTAIVTDSSVWPRVARRCSYCIHGFHCSSGQPQAGRRTGGTAKRARGGAGAEWHALAWKQGMRRATGVRAIAVEAPRRIDDTDGRVRHNSYSRAMVMVEGGHAARSSLV
jgi:hypothetical protein